MKQIKILFAIMLLALMMTGCGGTSSGTDMKKDSFTQITMDEAKEMMDDDGVVIVDVRRQDEYDFGHIPDAICIPNETISDKQPAELPDLDQVILVYCRSGRRSKDAAQKLFNMGYTNIYEFGGILDWDGEIVEEFDYEENDLDDVEEAATEEEPEDDEDMTTESKGTSNGSAGGKLPSGSGGSSYTTRKKTSTSSTTEFDPDDHDIEGYYEDNRDEFDDIDDAYDAFEDDEDAWDDY